MKVIHVTTVHKANDVRIYERECKSLIGKGYSVTLAAPGDIEDIPGLTFEKLNFPSDNRFFRLIRSQISFFRLTKTQNADVWHLHDPELLMIGLYLRLFKKKLVVWDAHEDYLEELSIEDGKEWIPKYLQKPAKNLMNLLLKLVDKFASGIIGATRQICSRYQNPNTFYVGNEVRVDDFLHIKPNFFNNRILYLGTTNSNYCFLEVVKAVAELPNLTLVVAGRPPHKEEWMTAYSILGERIIHLGWLNRKELASEMSRSSLGIVSYIQSKLSEDNSPTKHYEFAAAGLPIIATPTRSNISRIDKSRNGLVTDSFHSKDIAEAMRAALSDRERWNNWSSSGRIWARTEGNWSHSEARLLALYNYLSSQFYS